VGTNSAFLTIFYALGSQDYRFIMYFFPVIIYLGAIPLGIGIVKIKVDEKKNTIFIITILLLFYISLFLRGLASVSNSNIIYWIMILINEIILLYFLIILKKNGSLHLKLN
jgi:hypothetical protein